MALESLPKIAPALFSAEQDLIQIYNKKSDTVGTINASLIGTPPSGVSGAIQFSNGSAFGSDSANLFWDNVNKRLGVGTPSPLSTLNVVTPYSALNTDFIFSNSDTTNAPALLSYSSFTSTLRLSKAYSSVKVTNFGGNADVAIFGSGGPAGFLQLNQNGGSSNVSLSGEAAGYSYFLTNVGFGLSTTPTAKLQIKGSGSTSATSSLLVQNSSGNDIFRVNDTGTITVARSGSGVYKDVLVNTDGTPIIGSMSNDYIYFGGGFSQTYLISSAYLNILAPYLRGNSTQGNNKIAFNYVLDLNAYGNTSLPLVYNKYAGTVAFQSSGSANIHQTEVNLNFDAGGGGPRTLRAYYYNPTFVQGPQSYDKHYAWQNTLGAMIINSSTPQDCAVLQADSTTQGFLPPRMTDAQIRAIASPANGLIAYNTTTDHLCVYQGGAWVKINHSPM
jgi:hypothetical protein